MKRLFSYILCICLIVTSMGSSCFAEEATDVTEFPNTTEYPDEPERLPDIASEACIVMDAQTGQILYEKNAYEQKYPASITKIMTALLAIENCKLDETITMSENAVWGIERGSSHIALDVGEKISMEDALYAILLVSANEAAWGIAEHVGGTLKNFCEMMNQKAKDLGCKSTHFVNANGLHDDDHYTCAYDMALITKEALKYDTFRKITATTYHKIEPTNIQKDPRDLWQDNKLIKEESPYYYQYCEGAKTGFTDQARGTLVAWAKKGDIELICVTLHGYPSKINFTDTKAIFTYCFNNYEASNVFSNYEFSKEDIAEAENVLNKHFGGTNSGELKLSCDTEGSLLLNKNADLSTAAKFVASEDNIKDSIIGKLDISYNDQVIASIPVKYYGYICELTEATTTEEITTDASLVDDSKEDKKSGKDTKNNKKTHKKHSHLLLIVFIVFIVLAFAILFIRIRYVRYMRELNRKKRAYARKHNKP